MPPYSVLPTDRAASSSRGVRPPLAWSAGLAILLLLDVLLLYADRPLHQALFEGELGIVELPTFLMLIAAAIVAGFAARRERGGARIVFTLLALGCLYWGGEEVSWGQSSSIGRRPPVGRRETTSMRPTCTMSGESSGRS